MPDVDRLLNWPELARIVPYTRQHLGRLERAGHFPRRLKLGGNRVAWLEDEVRAWICARAEERQPIDSATPEAGYREVVARSGDR